MAGGLLLKCPRGERLSEMAGHRPGKSDYLPQTKLLLKALFCCNFAQMKRILNGLFFLALVILPAAC